MLVYMKKTPKENNNFKNRLVIIDINSFIAIKFESRR